MKRFIIIAAFLAAAFSASGQQLQQLPNDPAVRKGTLDNGMTYYIRHNELPAQRAEFYLATNVGAIQETPDQDGLAHFLEHMCFNGTKNFPGKGILNYLESIGASFGGNVNASTGVEQTQYLLTNIPLVNDSVIDNCLLIMHDYSHFVTCDPEEIDKERGVIIEERRSRRTASWRMHEQSLPYYYGDSKYATCTLIGSQENLETFKPESLVNFYKTWYRPDLQALIVVGDVDVDQVEAKIKTIFADIPAAVDPKPKDYIRIPDNKEPVIGIITDPEASSVNMELLWKSEATPEEYNSTVQGMMTDMIKSIISRVMYERFSDITAKPDAPFLNAGLAIGNLCESMEVVMGDISAKPGEAVSAFKAYLTEVEKMKRFGFTDAEVERAKTEMLSQYEAVAKRADTRKNAEFVAPLINNFFDNYAYMDPQAEFELAGMILPQLQAQVINSVLPQIITEENFVLLYKAPDKDGFVHPTEDEFRAAISEVRSSEITANEEEQIESDFLDPASLKGSKVKKEKEGLYGSTVWMLKNGVKVILLPTDYEKDRISFNLYKEGGLSLVPDEDMPSFNGDIYQLFMQNSGVSKFSATQVGKMLAGKQASASPSISGLYNGVQGSSTVKDFETSLQLMYLYYTDPRFDQDEYNQGIKTIEAVLPNLVNQPNYKLQTEMFKTVYDNPDRNLLISDDVLAKASLQTIERNYRKLFKDAAGSTMIIVGDFDLETVKPLIEKYVGSLPKGKKAPHWVNNHDGVASKNATDDFKVDMQTPKSTVLQIYKQPVEWSLEKAVAYNALEYVLDMVYTETLREDESGTYGASSSTEVSRFPEAFALLQVSFETNPTAADKLRALAVDGLEKIAADGPTAEQFEKTYNNKQKVIPESRITNRYWMSAIRSSEINGINYDEDYEAAVNALTPEKIQNAAKEILDGFKMELIMRPGKTAERE